MSPTKRPVRPPIAILTDFGCRDHYAGVLKGVIAKIAPGANVIDLTHGVPAHSVIAGALALREAWAWFPRRTIFLVVVDPGVGTPRRMVALETTTGARMVGPDNGVLWMAASQAGIKRIVELKSARYRLPDVSATFEGRDVMAPAAAYLWRGVRLGSLGPPVTRLKRLDLGKVEEKRGRLWGSIIHVDGFGNLISNIDRSTMRRFSACFRAKKLSVRIKRAAPIEVRRTYGDVRAGAALATVGSFDLLEIAVREASAARRFDAGIGTRINVAAAR